MAEEKKAGKKDLFYWKLSTGVLALLSIILIISLFTGGAGNVSESKALSEVAALIGDVYQVQLVPVNATTENGVYSLTYTLNGQELVLQATKNLDFLMLPSGQWIRVADLQAASAAQTQEPAQADVPKSDKPVADLYVFSYCPYGTQTEKGFVPVYNLLKNKADLNIIFIGAMHGEYEKTESLRQICIQKNYGKDKLMSYLDKFNTNVAIGNCGGAATCVNPLIATIMTSLSIDNNKINTCMQNDAPALYAADEQKSSQNGVSGSPTLVVNGVQVSTGRSPAALLATICSAFNTQPAECNQTLSSATPSAGFGGEASGSATSTAQC